MGINQLHWNQYVSSILRESGVRGINQLCVQKISDIQRIMLRSEISLINGLRFGLLWAMSVLTLAEVGCISHGPVRTSSESSAATTHLESRPMEGSADYRPHEFQGSRRQELIDPLVDFDFLLGGFERVVTASEQADSLFETLHRFVEAQLAAFEIVDDLLQRGQRFFEVRFRRLGIGCWLGGLGHVSGLGCCGVAWQG